MRSESGEKCCNVTDSRAGKISIAHIYLNGLSEPGESVRPVRVGMRSGDHKPPSKRMTSPERVSSLIDEDTVNSLLNSPDFNGFCDWVSSKDVNHFMGNLIDSKLMPWSSIDVSIGSPRLNMVHDAYRRLSDSKVILTRRKSGTLGGKRDSIVSD